MPKYIKKVTAQRCAVHKIILEECGTRLVEKGYFNKANVLESLGLTAMEDSVRWDYLADFLMDPQGDHAIELVPLAQRFFGSTRSEREQDSAMGNLGQYLAGGHGKKTAGYASVTFEEGRLAVKRAERFKSMQNGVSKAFKSYKKAVLERKNREQLSEENVTKIRALK